MSDPQAPAITLFCFPFAGGSAQTYARFKRHLSPSIDIVPLDPPGHGRRIDEPPVPSYQAMADDLFEQLREEIATGVPRFAMFGHSMGASLAFLIARRIDQAGLPKPMHLFVSGCAGPGVSPLLKDVYRLPDAEFLDTLKSLGGLRLKHLSPKELLALFLPVLRSDFLAASRFTIDATDAPLDVPVTAFLGEHDQITRDQPVIWDRLTRGRFIRHDLPGGHFFWLDEVDKIASVIGATVAP